MEPNDELKALLQEWPAAEPSPDLEQRVMRACEPRWRFFFTGYIRVPVAVVYAAAIVMALFVWKLASHAPPAICAAPAPASAEIAHCGRGLVTLARCSPSQYSTLSQATFSSRL